MHTLFQRKTHVAAAALLMFAGAASAQPPAQGNVAFDLMPVARGLQSPLMLTHAGDNSGRLFIVEQSGKILVMRNGTIEPTPFLDISSEMVTLDANYDERGLLGLAFHPDFANNGRFFVRYSRPRQGGPNDPCTGTDRGCHEEVLAEYQQTEGGAPGFVRFIFRVNKPEFNHNGGDVVFGPDGFLYFTLGDGGGANDDLHLPNLPHGPIGNGQNKNVPLGKVLRIDVDSAVPYAVPAANPFVNADGMDEVWAYGLRNPYRFSFDDQPGGDNRMWLTDVGQELIEEINIGQSGANYGWAIMEGPHCFDPFHPTVTAGSCNSAGLTLPIASYKHQQGIAIVGGFVYRGNGVPSLQKHYLFGDFTASQTRPDGHLFYIDLADPTHAIKRPRVNPDRTDLGKFVKGLGRDDQGELYVLVSSKLGPSGSSGQILKVVQCYANCDQNGGQGVLTANDFVCFLNHFAARDARANCDLSETDPVLNIIDFTCFISKFSSGCPTF